MACIRLNTINVDNELSIKNGKVLITNTDISVNSHNAALVVKGGISIYCTSDATSSINGGALTLGGGAGIKGPVYLGDNLRLDNTLSSIIVDGILHPRLSLESIIHKKFSLSLDGIKQNLLLTPSNMIIDLNSESSSSSSVLINASLFLNTNINSTSTTSGGCLTVNGGGSISGDLYIGESLFVSGGTVHTSHIKSTSLQIDTNEFLISSQRININSDFLNYNNNIIISSNDISINTPLTIYKNIVIKDNVTIDNNVYIDKNLTVSNDVFVKNMNVNNNINIKNEKTRILNYNDYMVFQADNGYIFDSTSSSLSIFSGVLHLNDYTLFNDNNGHLNMKNLKNYSYINIYPNDDSSDKNNFDNLFNLYNKQDCLKLGYNSSISSYMLSIETIQDSFKFNEFTLKNINGGFKLSTNGSFLYTLETPSFNSTTASCIFNGGVSINCDVNATSITHGGSLTLNGGLSILKDIYVGGDIYMNSSSFGNFYLSDTICFFKDDVKISLKSKKNKSNIQFSLHSFDEGVNNESFNIKSNDTNEYSICSLNDGDGQLYSIKIHTGIDNDNQLFISTNGNIGIKTSNPNYTLDVNGDLNCKHIYGQNISIQHDIGCKNVNVEKDVNIINDVFIHHDVFIKNDLHHEGIIHCTNKNNLDTILKIDGGAQIAKKLKIKGDLICDGQGYFETLLINNTIQCNNGVYIDSNTESNIGLSVNGSVLIHNDINISGMCNLHDTINVKSKSNQLLNIYDSVDVLRFGLNYGNSDLSISRHDDKNNFIENMVTFVNTSGSILFNNTTSSTSSTSGSIIMKGGLSINCSENVINISQGGALTIGGGMSVSKNMMVGGNVTILSTSQSHNIGGGALVINGGVGVMSNINIGGNAIINGDLIVKGNTTNISTENTSIKDNIFVLNSGPSGSHDSGLLVERYQIDNNKGKGDVVNDNPYIIDRLSNQNGIGSNQIKLSFLTSDVDDYYVDWWIKVDTGFSASQVRKIIKYEGITHIATLSSPWSIQNPANDDVVNLYNKPFIGMIFNERLSLFEFGSTVRDPSSSNVIFTDNCGIMFNNGLCVNTTPSTSSSSGAMVLTKGGMSIDCNEDAKNNTCGGSLTVRGGASINKTLFVGKDLYINNVKMTPNASDILSSISYTALNDQLDIPFMMIDKSVLSFDIFLGIVVEMIDPLDNLYCNFTIRGVNKKLSWEIESSFMGDDLGIEFDVIHDYVTSNGILRYSTPDYGLNISNIMFKYKMMTN